MEAFEIMGQGHSIELIISDINMPNLNGDEFIEILQDTGKLNDMEVVFITSSPKFFLSSSIKEPILGVIYKPFNFGSFNEQFQLLKKKKMQKEMELVQIKEAQVKQKEHIKDVCIKYLDKFELGDEKSDLTQFINENFGDDEVSKNEYPEIAYCILSIYIFEQGHSHTIDKKKLLCIFKSFEEIDKLNKNRFRLIDGFKSQIDYVNSNELKLKEILEELTTPLLDKISIALSNAKKFPKLNTMLYSPHFDYIIEEFVSLDCDFLDNTLQKLILEQKEIELFNKWMYNFLNKNLLDKTVNAVAESSALKTEVLKRLKKSYQYSILLSHHYCGQIEFYIWVKAKDSAEILSYLKTNMPKTIPCTPRFLLHKNKITYKEHKEYMQYEKQNVLVLSNNLKTLEIFKEIHDTPFDKWNFFCFTKISLLDAWISSNSPNKIIMDFNFETPEIKNGIEFLKFLTKKYPIFQNIVNLSQAYVITNKNNLIEVYKYKKHYNFSIIEEPLSLKNISEQLLYN